MAPSDSIPSSCFTCCQHSSVLFSSSSRSLSLDLCRGWKSNCSPSLGIPGVSGLDQRSPELGGWGGVVRGFKFCNRPNHSRAWCFMEKASPFPWNSAGRLMFTGANPFHSYRNLNYEDTGWGTRPWARRQTKGFSGRNLGLLQTWEVPRRSS